MSGELVPSSNSGASGGGYPESPAGGVVQQGRSASPSGSYATRKAEIEKVMHEDIDAYHRLGLSREYLEILEEEQLAVDPDAGVPTRPMRADVSRTAMGGSEAGAALVAHWENYGGFTVHLANVQKDVGQIVRLIGGNREQRAFMERFDREVPLAARLALYDEIAGGPPTIVTPASEAQVRLFATTPAGKVLVAEWGPEAARLVAVLRVRAARLTEALDEDDAADLWAWIETLSDHAATVIFRKMAG